MAGDRDTAKPGDTAQRRDTAQPRDSALPSDTAQPRDTAPSRLTVVDGNEAVAETAYRLSEVIAIYPITPASAMAEASDAWAAAGRPNLWGAVPEVIQMQSEAGAAGALHGAALRGALATTFTASQGLLLMLPNMFKLAGELTPTVIHVAARAVATHALSIFGDHSDVMAARTTGFAMLSSGSVQEAADFAAVAHAATLESRVPFLHFFDGFRTSHEVATVEIPDDVVLTEMIDEQWIVDHRARALDPDRPVLRGSAQNPDVFFQAREAGNGFTDAVPKVVEAAFERFATATGRRYGLVEYDGAPDAERVIVVMGSAAGAALETVERMMGDGERVGVLRVRLYRPFPVDALVAALPPTVQRVAVLDRTKEPGASGEPLYLDVVEALASESQRTGRPMPVVIGGRYGLASKEFTPAMVHRVFTELAAAQPQRRFTIGITDDVSQLSLRVDTPYDTDTADLRAVFFGLGSDGTVSANKHTAKIVGEVSGRHSQGYFVYDSKKSGSMTTSHLRFADRPIRSTYLIERADLVAVHQFGLLERLDLLATAREGAALLLNSPWGPDRTWEHLPAEVQQSIIDKGLRPWVIDAHRVARDAGLAGQINTVMQVAFFAVTELIPFDVAVQAVLDSVERAYAKRGTTIVAANQAAARATVPALFRLPVPTTVTATHRRRPVVPDDAPDFVTRVTARMLAGEGDLLPVSALPVDGSFPTATSRHERRRLAAEIPVWDPDICIDCARCALVCPHAAIRVKMYEPDELARVGGDLPTKPFRSKERAGLQLTVQVSPEDCTGCGVCVDVCPGRSKSEVKHKAIDMLPVADHFDVELARWQRFGEVQPVAPGVLDPATVKGSQTREPLFEFSGACAGCGETPYLKLLSQLFGDRSIVANATGCSSIYGGNLPTTPWATDAAGRGPAWANSLFEDNAEFGLGIRLALDGQAATARHLLGELRDVLDPRLAADVHDDTGSAVDALLSVDPSAPTDDATIAAQRERVARLDAVLDEMVSAEAGRARAVGMQASATQSAGMQASATQSAGAQATATKSAGAQAGRAGSVDLRLTRLRALTPALVRRNVWIVGGDGWAYDIGSGGLDHVLGSGRDVNILVLDTEVYSNTGGQASKSTSRGAVAKFAAGGKVTSKKDLGAEARRYGNVYVAQIAVGANDVQTVKAFAEAEAWPGPSLIIAYSTCIAHGLDMTTSMTHQKDAVRSGYWPLYRYKPDVDEHTHPFQLDCADPSIALVDFVSKEARYAMLQRSDPDRAAELMALAQADVDERWRYYLQLAGIERSVVTDGHDDAAHEDHHP